MKAFLIIALFFISTLTQAQKYQWAKQVVGPFGGGDYGKDIKVDANGFVYITGIVSTADLDPGAGTSSMTHNYLGKYDGAGNLVWVFNLIPDASMFSSWVQPNGLALDAAGNIVMIGEFQGTVDFDPGPDTAALTTGGPGNLGYMAKYDNAGNFIWAKTLGTDGTCTPLKVIIRHNHIFVSGLFRGVGDFDPNAGTSYLFSAGLSDCFFASYDNSGNLTMAKSFGSSADDVAQSIDVAPDKDIVVSGYVTDTTDFDPGAGTYLLSPYTTIGTANSFVARYDSTGNIKWAYVMYSSEPGMCFDVVTNDDGDIYASGYHQASMDIDPGPGTTLLMAPFSGYAYMIKYDKDGHLLWGHSLGLGYTDARINGAVLDAEGNYFISGQYSGHIDFDPSPGVDVHHSVGGLDIFFAKYTPAGTLEWAAGLGGIYWDLAEQIAVDNNQGVYITGYFGDTCDFDPHAGIANMTCPGGEYQMDIYFAKYKDCIPFTRNSASGLPEGETVNTNGLSTYAWPSEKRTGVQPNMAVRIDTSACLQNGTPSAINETLNKEIAVQLFPNPGNGHFTIEMETASDLSIKVMNANGQLVFANHYENVQKAEIGLTVESGLYLVEILTPQGRTIKRLSVQR